MTTEQKKSDKPMYKNISFWLSLAAVGVGAVFGLGLPADSAVMQVAGVIASILGALRIRIPKFTIQDPVIPEPLKESLNRDKSDSGSDSSSEGSQQDNSQEL